jgi:hypothetical protein
MRRKSKLQLIQQSKVAEPVSTFSREEEARLIGLADVALHNEPAKASRVAGDHARREHESLKRALEDAVERIKKEKDGAA